MKHKISAVVAIALVAAAAMVGVLAVSLRSSDHDDKGGSASPHTAGAPAASGDSTLDPSDRLVIPKGVVNPLSANDYCGTAKLLAIYTKQGYGLNKHLGLVDGKKFDRRLKTVAATFQRLANQAPAQDKTGNVAPHWQRLAAATTKAEKKLRVFGFRAQSQAMIVELARWNELSTVELPQATATLKAACGFSPAVFGI